MTNATDFLRQIGWGIVNFIYKLIDTVFDILKEINVYDITRSVSENSIFKNIHTGIMAMAITLLALFIAWRFVMKVLDPENEMSTQQIALEIVKCSMLVLMSVFLFTQANDFSVKLSGWTGSIFENNNTKISTEMLNMYVNHADGYKESDEFKNENIKESLKNKKFTDKEMYNDQYVTSKRFIRPDKKEYKYDISWIMAILVGGFFLYALFFAGMMLARRQIEFLFLFVISPIVFATSIGNKQRRGAVIEQLVSLVLQGAVVMLIITLTVIMMNAINDTTFFTDNNFKDMALKSVLFVGCATFLITGSQVINRFIGANVSANSGREQLMSLMSFGHVAGGVSRVAGGLTAGAGAIGLGVAASGVGKLGGNALVSKVGGSIQNFGKNMNSNSSNFVGTKAGSMIERFGAGMKKRTPSAFGKNMRSMGTSGIANSVMPRRQMYRNRYRGRI